MFEGFGFYPVRQITKQRDVYFLKDCHVTLDHAEPFGDFVEVAIMVEREDQINQAERKVAEVISVLGLEHAELETRSYAQMADTLANSDLQ